MYIVYAGNFTDCIHLKALVNLCNNSSKECWSGCNNRSLAYYIQLFSLSKNPDQTKVAVISGCL